MQIMRKGVIKHIYMLLESAMKIEEVADKESLSSFLSPNSWIKRDAVARRFLILASISEILLNKYEDFCLKYQEIPLAAMRGMKRYLTQIHDGDIDWAIIWQTTQKEIPDLIEQLRETLRDLIAVNG